MKETKKLPLAFLIETLILSRRNKLGQLMCVPRRGWQSLIRDDPLRGEAGSRLSEMIHFGKADVTCKVSDPSIAHFHQRRSNLLVVISSSEDPTSFANLRKIQLLDGKICHYAKDHSLVLVTPSVLVAPSAIM